MSKNNKYKTLLLIIDERNGVVGEYQKQLYEASILGIDRVLPVYRTYRIEEDNINFVKDMAPRIKNTGRIKDMALKLAKTCDILQLKLLQNSFVVWDDYVEESRIVMTDDNGTFLPSSISMEKFSHYKEKHVDKLKKRKKIGKVLVK